MSAAFKTFIDRWGCDYDPHVGVSSDQLDKIELALKTLLPSDFRQALIIHGIVSTKIDLLNLIVDDEHDVLAISAFLKPHEIQEDTLTWWDIGMPRNLIVIAGDYLGNKFCVELNPATRASQGAIWFWDHDFDETEKLANSFDEWISQYTTI